MYAHFTAVPVCSWEIKVWKVTEYFLSSDWILENCPKPQILNQIPYIPEKISKLPLTIKKLLIYS